MWWIRHTEAEHNTPPRKHNTLYGVSTTSSIIAAHASTASFFTQQHVLVMQSAAEKVDRRATEAVLAKMQERNVGHVFVAKRREELLYSDAMMEGMFALTYSRQCIFQLNAWKNRSI